MPDITGESAARLQQERMTRLASAEANKASAMTKREAFAMAAMQGMCADRSWDGNSYAVFAKDAVKRADALIEALKETP